MFYKHLLGASETRVNKAKAIFEEMKTIAPLTIKRKICSVASSSLCFLLWLTSAIPVVEARGNSASRLPYVYSATS